MIGGSSFPGSGRSHLISPNVDLDFGEGLLGVVIRQRGAITNWGEGRSAEARPLSCD